MPNATHQKGFDWQDVHRRIDAAWSALEQKMTPDEGSRRQILQARAKLLARAPVQPQRAERPLEIVEFLLAGEHYGVESSYVREVCPLRDLRPLIGTAPFVLGLINVRGQILSVIDMKRVFDLPDKGLTSFNRVLILRAGQLEAGVLADALLAVRPISRSDLQPALPTLTGLRADHIKGVTKDPIVVLDIEKFFSDKRIIVDEG